MHFAVGRLIMQWGGVIPNLANVVCWSSKSFGLGVFTFISGFVLYYQAKKQEAYRYFIRKKVKRILVPCLFWACVYGVFFSSYMYSNWPAVVNGTHLWYLPMLFLCIMVTSAHLYIKRPWAVVAVCYISIALLEKISHFRTFTEFCFYFPVFYVGFLANKFRLSEFVSKHKCWFTILAIVAALVQLRGLEIGIFTSTLKKLVISLSVYSLLSMYCSTTTISKLANSLSRESFSIYLLHQFVINILLGCFNLAALSYGMALAVIFSCALIIPWVLSFFYGVIRRRYVM